jgi:hypothetical protein
MAPLIGTFKLLLPANPMTEVLIYAAPGFVFPEHLVLRLLLPEVLKLMIDPSELSKATCLVSLKFEFVDSVLDCVLIFHTISIRESE